MIISLCSGYGGLDRAVAARFGLPIAAHAEPDKIRLRKDGPLVANPVLKVLEARFPGVPNLGDIRETDWSGHRADVLCAGFPCQPVSAAGRQMAEDDERWLWPSVHRAIPELAPEWIVLENVANIVSIQGGAIWRMILGHLREAGYDVAWGIFGACLVGACHHRHRMFLVARRGVGAEALHWQRKPCGAVRPALPTPRATDGTNGGPSQRGSAGDLAMGSAVQPEHWGRFAAAVQRAAGRYGVPPAPTETGPKGGVRMAAPFPEWMMGLAPGYVTGILPRNDALRAIGNGVMPQQGYYAIGELRGMLDA